jgi:Methyltransferase domain
MKRNFCPACNSEKNVELEKINLEIQHTLYAPNDPLIQIELTKAARESADSYIILKCADCRLEYASPFIAPNKNWYKYAYKILSLYPSDRWEFNYVLELLKPQDYLGEFGCGSGSFLKKCIAKNVKCKGYDFSDKAIEECIANNVPASIMSLSDCLMDENIDDMKFTHFASFHVLEHLDRPDMLFELARKYSKDKSEFWISVPSDKRATRFLGEVDFLDQPPHHITRWNKSSLASIGKSHGWILKDLIYEPITVPTILWYYSTRLLAYKKMERKINLSNIFLERMLRLALSPCAVFKWLRNKDGISGFSMLARYQKLETI